MCNLTRQIILEIFKNKEIGMIDVKKKKVRVLLNHFFSLLDLIIVICCTSKILYGLEFAKKQNPLAMYVLCKLS